MIKNNEPLSMVEVMEHLKKNKDAGTEVSGFIKKFTKLNQKEVTELKEKIKNLNLMKVNLKHIAKIMDLMPENAEDLNKIFIDISLDEDETKKILETVKEFK